MVSRIGSRETGFITADIHSDLPLAGMIPRSEGRYLLPVLTWPNQTEVTVNGVHFVQEDSATEIAQSSGGSSGRRNGCHS
jgi:hypothetical protein